MACDAEVWRGQLAALGPHAAQPPQVSDVHHRAASLPEMAALLLAEQPGELVLVGCSLGGMLALEVQRQCPERVRGLGLLGSTARPDAPELITLRQQAIVEFAAGRVEPLIRINAMFAFHPDHRAAFTQDYVAMILRAGGDSLIRQNLAVMARADLRPHLPAVRCPVLVAGGLDDTLTPPECSREMARALPHAELHLLPRCGHMLTWEQAQPVTDMLLDWLARVPDGPLGSSPSPTAS